MAERAVTSVEQTLPRADVPLEDEIADVSASLSMTAGHLRRIALLLGSETESRLRQEIEEPAAEHDRQIERSRRSGIRMALWTFVGGVVVVAVPMS